MEPEALRALAKRESGCYIRYKENGGISRIRLHGEWNAKKIRGMLNEEG